LIGGEEIQKARRHLIQNDIPTYETPEDAVKTYLYMYKYFRNLKLLYETPAELPTDLSPPKHHLKTLIKRAITEGRKVLTEEESKRFLINYGIPTTKPYISRDVEDAVYMASKVGYPIVLKITSPDITHKSDIGGVLTGIVSDEELRAGYSSLIKKAKENVPEARMVGVSIQKMILNLDYELILGVKKDKDFGSVILFGMGGIEVEIFKDFSIGLPPLNQTLAKRLMEETKVYQMLKGFRGKTPADMRQLEQILVSFSNLIVDFPEIAEMDINPLAVSNGKPNALDARIIVDRDALKSTLQYPHLVITPYPMRYIIPWKMSDGTEVTLRPIRPEDEPLEHEMLTTLSKETMVGRFFQAIKDITHEMLIRFCNIDYDREMAIVSELREDKKRRIIGIGRLIIEADFKSAEFAVVVHDTYQGRGLGHKLIDTLIGIAQEKEWDKIYGVVLTDNKRMLAICKEFGFTVKHLPDGISVVELALM
jgi:acetyltransferase